jgi:peptidoglycan/LPS O-acetylase OafA/YrhL
MTAAAPRHVRGIDGLRFVLAFWVVMSHSGFAPGPAPWLHVMVRTGYNGLANGAAAVMVFFVISGFCIHYPFRSSRSIDLLSFYARRHIRILVPVVAAVLIARPLGTLPTLWDSILWSLICEEIYYTIYPLLLELRARHGWNLLIGVAAVAAVAIALMIPHRQLCGLNAFPWYVNWVVGLPAWMMGARLAEKLDLDTAMGRAAILRWRLGALVAGGTVTMLCYHAPIRIPAYFSLMIAIPYAAGWLRAEILHAESHGPPLFERLGVFSYSMYLMHLSMNVLFDRIFTSPMTFTDVPMLMYLLWLARAVWVVAASWLFYRLVERPAHRFARHFQQKVLALRQPRNVAA